MTRKEIITLLIQNGWQIRVDEQTGEATLYDEALEDEHLLNMVKQYKKLPVVLVEEP